MKSSAKEHLKRIYNRNPERFESTFRQQQERKYHIVLETLELVSAPALPSLQVCRILDLGCGTNMFAEFSGLPVIGVDFAQALLSRARQKQPQAPLILADIDSLPFKTQRFDLVIAITVLIDRAPHEILWVLAEVQRVLVSGGIFACSLVEQDLSQAQEDVLRKGPLPLIAERACDIDRLFVFQRSET